MRKLLVLGLLVLAVLVRPPRIDAAVSWGVHILSPAEIDQVIPLRGEGERFYVTVPMELSDRRVEVWNDFFKKARDARITPLVRWVTRFENGSWRRPGRKEMIDAARFLSILEWQEPRHLILFNETNRADEWGGVVEPESYGRDMAFIAQWLKTERHQYLVLPAGMDAAAPNTSGFMDSLQYLKRMFFAAPELLTLIDGLTSHSYPNPGFVASAYVGGKHSIRGFEEELKLMSSFGRGDIPVYITETGWKATRQTVSKLTFYYQYAAEFVWDNPQVTAVTVFLLQGTSGPFAEFSLLDKEGEPTTQLKALQKAMEL